MDVLDRAIHGNVLINGLDARGLWTDPSLDASRPTNAHSAQFLTFKSQYDREAASAQADVLAEMAYGTGGNFFQNNNDLDEGDRKSTRLNSSHLGISYAVFCLKKKKQH